MQILEYDPKSASSIFEYSKKIINKTLRDFIDDDELILNVNKKGELGSLVEKYFFKLVINNKSEADFKEAGLELKTTGVKKLSKGGYTPKERLVLGKIDYHTITEEEFQNSHILDKIKFMLLLFYLYDNQKVSIDQTFIKNMLWKMSDMDFAIMKNDFKTIVDKIRDGRAHELSESDTLYLSACTKGATSKDRTSQPYSKEAAKPRAFAFKQSYLKTIFDSDKADVYDSILTNAHEFDINNYVSSKLNKYIGKSFSTLYEEFGNGLNIKTKNIKQLLVYRMLGVKKKRIEEFDKAGIITKVIKFEQSDVLKESISFPAFKFKEIASQDWEESDFKNICESKFLFLIFQKTSYGEVFRGFKFWSMPYKDRVEAERVWYDTSNKIKENNTSFLGIRDSTVAHVRPHGQNADDMDQLPNGGYFGKRSFWFNAKYIESQVKIYKVEFYSENKVLDFLKLKMVGIPLVGSAPCGNPMLGEENIEKYIEVEKSKIKPGFNYFILRAIGDSMDLAGINDGDLVLCRQQLKADTGDRVVAFLGDNVTIKVYGPRKDGVRFLLPKSSNSVHAPIAPNEGDSVQGIVQEVLSTD